MIEISMLKHIFQPRDDANNEGGPGRRLRKNVANVRRHIDYVATVLNHVEVS